MSDRVLLQRFSSLIERDAFVSRLAEAGISCETPERDMIVNVTDQPNLSLGGYSAMFEGYELFVHPRDLEKTRELLTVFQRQSHIRVVPAEEPLPEGLDLPGRRFLSCTLWSFVIPGVMNVLAVYWLFRSRNLLRERPSMAMIAVLLNLGILVLVTLFLWETLNRIILGRT